MRYQLYILVFLCCICSIAAGQNPADSEKPKGRKPLVVLKQAAIEGQVLLLAEKDGQQVPAEDVEIQVRNIDTRASLFKTTTDKNGKYTLPNFDIGKYQFIVGRLKLELEIIEAQKPGKRITRISKKIIIFIPQGMR